MESGDVIGSTRAYTHAAWDLHHTADWADVLNRALELVGTHEDNEDAMEWSVVVSSSVAPCLLEHEAPP